MYARYGADVKLDSKDVAMMSAMIKVARAAVNPNYLDNWVDLGGYAVCGGGIARREKGVAPAGTAGIQVPSTAQPDYTKEPNA
jgi:hypothetical protein